MRHVFVCFIVIFFRPAFRTHGRKGGAGGYFAELHSRSLSETRRPPPGWRAHPTTREGHRDQIRKEDASNVIKLTPDAASWGIFSAWFLSNDT